MANSEHLRIVRSGPVALAAWQGEPGNREVRLDLCRANLSGANLSGAALGTTWVLQLGPLGPHGVYHVVLRHPDWAAEEARLGCEQGTLASFKALALERYGDKWEDHYGPALAYAEAWQKVQGQ